MDSRSISKLVKGDVSRMEDRQGLLIAIDGPDGSGKETQTKQLEKRLKDAGYDVLRISFPNYESSSSDQVKKYLAGEYTAPDTSDPHTFIDYVTEVCSFYAKDRLQTFETPNEDGKNLFERLKEGTIIISDRYTTANMIHQSAIVCDRLKDDELARELIKWIHDFEFNHFSLPKPNLFLYLDVEPEISIENIKRRYNGEEKEDILENINHQKSVYKMKDYVTTFMEGKKIICSENGKMKNVEDISNAIHTEVLKIIK